MHLSLHYHVVFSTKERRPLISPPWGGRLHGFLGGIVRQMEGTAEAVGGVADHMHLLVGLGATHRLFDVVREIQSVSSRWVHDELGLRTFSWQAGYGAFTVSASHRAKLREYILGQDEHHRARSFQEEYLDFLRKRGVEYDEDYLW